MFPRVFNICRSKVASGNSPTAFDALSTYISNHELIQFVRERILQYKEAPDVVAFRMKNAGRPGAVCTKTLYNYIDQDLIAGNQQ